MKQITILILSLFCLNINAQKGKVYQDKWYSGEVDKSDNYSFFEKGKLYYSLSNNKDIMCLDIKVDDSGVQSRIIKEGMTIWIDANGKQTKKLGIRFPIGGQRAEGRTRTNNMPARNPDGSPATLPSLANTIELVGFTGEDSRRFPADNPNSFRGYVKYNSDGTLLYRMIIPMEKIPFKNSKDGAGAAPITIGIEYGRDPSMIENRGPESDSFSESSSSGRGGGGSRGGSRGGGGGGGGSRGGGASFGGGPNSPSQNIIPPVSLWIKNIVLATDK